MTPKKFIVYKSSAGSGKTFTLVREFLRLVIVNPPLYRNILAITFTNKAANEMKERITKSLVELSENPTTWPAPLTAMIAPLLDEEKLSETEIHQKARQVLGNILHNYSDLSTSTIDSFMQRVIRTFSNDLQLPQNYEVELDLNMLKSRAVDRLIDLAGSDKALTTLLVRYVETKTDEDKSWRIEKELNTAAGLLFKEESAAHRHRLTEIEYADFIEIHKNITAFCARIEQQLQQIADNAFNAMEKAGVEITDFAFGKSGFPGYFIKIRNKDFSGLDTPGSRVIKAVEEDQWTAAKTSSAIRQKIESIAPNLKQAFYSSQEILKRDLAEYLTMKLLQKNVYPMAVLSGIENIINQIREEERILPISEFNRIIAGITLNEPVPYIYERLGEKYRHLMIDEFQDTSVLQWQNLLPLVENSLAGNNLNLIVGDAKQAIYRWRSGEVEQFIALPALPGEDSPLKKLREHTLGQHFSERELPVNWRSHKIIVDFNNMFFNHIAKCLSHDFEGVYKGLNQQNNPSKNGGMVQLEFFDSGEDYGNTQLSRIAEIIEELRSSGYNLSDIAILCRENKSASLIANHLLNGGLRVISSESLLLSFSQNVRLVMDFLTIVANPLSQVAYAEALQIMAEKGLIKVANLHESVNSLFGTSDDNPQKKVFSPPAFEDFLRKHQLAFSRSRMQQMHLYDQAEEIIRMFQLPLQRDIYLQFFLNEMHRAVSSGTLTANNLKEWWEEKGSKTSVIFPDGLDAVMVLTIHKSKGLEFPAVIYPFADSSLREGVGDVWVDLDSPVTGKLKTACLPVKSLSNTTFSHLKERELEKSMLDLINLLYVALTRAEERLYVLTKSPGGSSGKASADLKSVPAFFHDFIHRNYSDFDFTDSSRFLFPGSVESKKKASSGQQAENLFLLKDKASNISWQQKILTSCRRPRHWNEGESAQARSSGTMVHEILAKTKETGSLATSINDLVLTGDIQRDEAENLTKMLENATTHPMLCRFFAADAGLRAEPEILLPSGEMLRPDRLLIADDSIHIAEFKTGSPHTSHLEQLLNYMKIVQQMYQKPITGYLAYIQEDRCDVSEHRMNE